MLIHYLSLNRFNHPQKSHICLMYLKWMYCKAVIKCTQKTSQNVADFNMLSLISIEGHKKIEVHGSSGLSVMRQILVIG